MDTPTLEPRDVTGLLHAWADGDIAAGDRLFPLVYAELHRISEGQLRRQGAPVTLQATEVIHEAYLRLADQNRTDWRNRAHFFALAATMMRRVLCDHARRRLAQRRDRRREVPLDGVPEPVLMSETEADEIVRLDEALCELAREDARRAQVVELRWFAGMGVEETAEVMELSPATVKRDWTLARAWLRTRVEADSAGQSGTRPAGGR